MANVVLDASAVLAVLNSELGAELVIPELDGATLSTVNYAEVMLTLANGGSNREVASEAVLRLGIRIADFDKALAERTGELRPLTRHRGLSLGDRACIAPASRLLSGRERPFLRPTANGTTSYQPSKFVASAEGQSNGFRFSSQSPCGVAGTDDAMRPEIDASIVRQALTELKRE